MERNCTGFKSWTQTVPKRDMWVYWRVAEKFGIKVSVTWAPTVNYVCANKFGGDSVASVPVPLDRFIVTFSGPGENFANGHSYWDVVAGELMKNESSAQV